MEDVYKTAYEDAIDIIAQQNNEIKLLKQELTESNYKNLYEKALFTIEYLNNKIHELNNKN